jgi:DNA-directed RNA polymerase subunit M/transcription elongation factor TFIIS
MSTSFNENLNNELDFDNFSYDREFIKRQKFLMSNSCFIPIGFIKFAETQIDRKQIIERLDNFIKCLPISIQVEKGLFEFALNYIKTSLLEQNDFYSIYMDKFNEIHDNLDMHNNNINNQTLLPSLLDGTISAQILPFLKMYQLHPIRWKHIIDKNNLRDLTLYTVNSTDEFKCGRCGERKHTYYITQTRSADEPATVFYTCINCKKTFTKSI